MMRRFALLLAVLAAFCVGLVPVVDGVAKVEAAISAVPQAHHDAASPKAHHDHAAAQGHECKAADCGDHGVKPHPGHCPACTALPAGFEPYVAAPAKAAPAAGGPERLFAVVPPVDLPPPRSFHA